MTGHKPCVGRFLRVSSVILWLCLLVPLSPPVSACAAETASTNTASTGKSAVTFTNLLARADAATKHKDVPGAIKWLKSADAAAVGNSAELCIVTHRYCDVMFFTTAPDLQKQLAQTSLDCAQRALAADPKNPTAHLCVAICYAKNFPYVDNRTEVKWSKAIKTEAETAIALDPKLDLGYYLLGRWNYDTANINFVLRGLVRLIYGGLPPASTEAAIKNYQKAIALVPGRILTHLALAHAYQTTGQTKLAITELKNCATLKPLDLDDTAAQKDAAALLSKIAP